MDHSLSVPRSFSGHDRRRLADMLRRTSDVRLFRRVQAVLRVAEGDPIPSVARSLRVSGRSLQRWVQVYRHRRRPEDLLDARRSGRPRAAAQLDQATLAQVLAQDPRALGYRATTWTTPLLTTHLNQECGCSISERTLRRRLQEGGWRRLKRKQPGDVLLFADWTLLRLFPPLRAAWSRVGEQARVPVTGRNAKRVLFGAINVHTGHRVVLSRKSAGGADARAFLTELRRRYGRARTI